MENKKLIIGITEQSYSLICYRISARVEILACEIYDKKMFNRKTLKKFLEKQKLNQIDAKIILGQKIYRILMIDRPNIKDEEFTQAAQWLAKDLINDKLEDVIVDAFPTVERVDKTNKLYLVIANKKYLQSLYEMCFVAGVHLTELTIAEFGFLQLAPDSNQVSIIIYSPKENDIRVLIVYNGKIDFIRNIKIKTALSQDNNLRCEEVAFELNRSIDFYATQFGDAVKEILYIPCEFFSEDFVNLLKKQMTIYIAVLYDNSFSNYLGDSRWNKHIMAFGLIPSITAEHKNDKKIDFLFFLKKPQTNFFTANKIILCTGVFCLVLLILIFIQKKQITDLEKSINELQQQFNILQKKIADKNKNNIVSLEGRLMNYKEENKLGFNGLTDFLKKISEINLCGLWLAQINISDGGRHVGLQGQFYQKELIFKYQQGLQQWPLLSDDVLTLNLTGPTKQEQPFQFSMIWDKRENE